MEKQCPYNWQSCPFIMKQMTQPSAPAVDKKCPFLEKKCPYLEKKCPYFTKKYEGDNKN